MADLVACSAWVTCLSCIASGCFFGITDHGQAVCFPSNSLHPEIALGLFHLSCPKTEEDMATYAPSPPTMPLLAAVSTPSTSTLTAMSILEANLSASVTVNVKSSNPAVETFFTPSKARVTKSSRRYSICWEWVSYIVAFILTVVILPYLVNGQWSMVISSSSVKSICKLQFLILLMSTQHSSPSRASSMIIPPSVLIIEQEMAVQNIGVGNVKDQ